jgi:REP-associated tyrosine transposase
MSSDRLPSRKYKTCRRYNVPGDAHSLTFNCFHRRPFLSKDRTCQWLVDALTAAREKWQFDIWAYVIMPEHCHVLIFPRRPKYSVSQILESVKLPVTRKAKAYLERTAPDALRLMRDEQPNGAIAYRFWQRGGGYDRNLNEPKAIHAEIAYIHANPVRRGLVAKPEDWRWSSAGWYAGLRDARLVPDMDSLPRLRCV